MTRLSPVHIQIPRSLRQHNLHSAKLLIHLHLASQPRCPRQPECEVQQVLFLVLRRWQFGVNCARKDDMASGAGQASLACALQFHIIFLGDFQEMAANLRLHLSLSSVPEDEAKTHSLRAKGESDKSQHILKIIMKLL